MADEAMLAMANGKDDDDCQAGGLGLSRDEVLQRYGVDIVLSALPHLTGDELRRVAEAMPRVAGEWAPNGTGYKRMLPRSGYAIGVVQRAGHGSWDALSWTSVGRIPIRSTTHPTARAAQAACDARLDAAGVRLCGEVVRDGE